MAKFFSWLGDNGIRIILWLLLSIDAYIRFGWEGLLTWAMFVLFMNEQIHSIVKANENR